MSHQHQADRQGRGAILAGALGTVSEWYAYGIYGTASALYIGPLFFSTADPTSATLLSFATLAIGYLARPVGAVVLGHVGDRRGRKFMLLLTISIMAAAGFLIGCLPTYPAVGVLAPVLLVILRLIEGFGAGAELAGALTYANESAPARRRAFYSSFIGAASYGGILIGTIVFAVLNGLLPSAQMLAWGWRVPFLLSAVIVIVPLIARSRVAESRAFTASSPLERSDTPVAALLRSRKTAILAGFLSQAVIGISSYVVAVFSLSYLTNVLKLQAQLGLIAIIIAGSFSIVAALGFGLLADRIGAVRVLAAAAILSALFAFPFFLLLDTAQPVPVVVAVSVGYALTFGMTSGAQGLFLPALFQTRYRLSGVAISRELANALLGGTAPLVAAALVATLGGAPWLVACLMIAASLLTLTGVGIGAAQLRTDGRAAGAPGGLTGDDETERIAVPPG